MLLNKNNILEIGWSLLEQGKSIKIRVNGTSMYPFLQNDDLVEIEKTDLEDLEIGDIVVFKNQDRWLAHRLIKKQISEGETKLITKGDSCLKFDETFGKELYVGKITNFERENKSYSLNDSSFKTFTKRIINSNGLMNYVFYIFKFFVVKFGK
jgi:signal peptidase I